MLRPLYRPLRARFELPFHIMLPRIAAVEHSIRQIEDAIGRLDGAQGKTWGQVQDIDVRAAHDRTLIAALRSENGNLVRGWLRMRTDLLRLEQGAGSGWVRIAPGALAGLMKHGEAPTLYLSRDGSRREGALTVGEREQDGAELIADFADLPFPDRSVAAIVVSGPGAAADPALVAHWRAKLRPGGEISFAAQ